MREKRGIWKKVRVAVWFVLDGGGLGPRNAMHGGHDDGIGGEWLTWKRHLMTSGRHRVQCQRSWSAPFLPSANKIERERFCKWKMLRVLRHGK